MSQLPLPPGPDAFTRVRYLLRFAIKGDKEAILRELIGRYGNTVWLKPYLILCGPDANRFLSTQPASEVKVWPNDEFPTLASMEGDLQLRHRKLVMAAFQAERLQRYAAQMPALIHERARRWGPQLDVQEQMHELSFELLLATLLGIHRDSPVFQSFVDCYWPLVLREESKPRLGRAKRVANAKARMWKLLEGLIAERRANPGDDALSAMIRAADSDPQGPPSAEELTRYAYMLMDFGQGDLAVYLSYLLGVIATRPELMERVVLESARYDAVSAANAEGKLPLTLNLMRELERRYPPVTEVHRIAASELSFRGFRIPKGTYLIACVEVAHLSAENFAEPLKFDPDRFAPPREEHKKPFSLLGFGAGRHMCVASQYSRMVGAVVLHELLREHRFQKLGSQQLPELDYSGTLQRPSEPILLSRSGVETQRRAAS